MSGSPSCYFVALYVERATLLRVKQSETLKLTREQEGRLKEVDVEVLELAGRMGGSVRRKVNEHLVSLGYPELKKCGVAHLGQR